jgi:hypothetical protein
LRVDAGVYGLKNVIREVFERHGSNCLRDTIICGHLTMQWSGRDVEI